MRQQFISGLIATIPVSGTIFIFYLIFNLSEQMFGHLLTEYFGIYFIGVGVTGLILTMIVIWLIGIITSSYVGKKIMDFQEFLFLKIPFLNSIFRTLKQLSHGIFDNDKKSFKYPVLVEIFNRHCYSIGFVTGKKSVRVGSEKNKVYHVFVPTAPNPTSGFLILTSREKLKRLNMTIEEAFKTIVTAGIVHKNKYRLKK
ncbi:MAG: DUF502 domain-containing protein [Spirochaetales bacterium]|nr:DUF502 domain-containing protein [Spirochaetales bacterium]